MFPAQRRKKWEKIISSLQVVTLFSALVDQSGNVLTFSFSPPSTDNNNKISCRSIFSLFSYSLLRELSGSADGSTTTSWLARFSLLLDRPPAVSVAAAEGPAALQLGVAAVEAGLALLLVLLLPLGRGHGDADAEALAVVEGAVLATERDPRIGRIVTKWIFFLTSKVRLLELMVQPPAVIASVPLLLGAARLHHRLMKNHPELKSIFVPPRWN